MTQQETREFIMLKSYNELSAMSDLIVKDIKSKISESSTIPEVLNICKKVIKDWPVLPNPNRDKTYCQFIIYPPNGFSFSFTHKLS